jgi:cytochrome c7-like protein
MSTRRNAARLVPGWVAVLACLAAVVAGLAGHDAAAQPAPAPTGSASAAASAAGTAAPPANPEPSAEPAEPAPPAAPPAPGSRTGGLAPLPGGAMVPLEDMPPGTGASPLPSDEIFPPQTLTIRFNHDKHFNLFKQTCKVCHAAAYKSSRAADNLLPDPRSTCDNCHDVDHSDQEQMTGRKQSDDPAGRCDFCHLGAGVGEGGQVAKLVIPQPNLRMSHKAHLDRNIDCAQCHGMIQHVELATREQLPRMAGCFSCHAKSGAAQGEAKGHCTNCHLAEPNGTLLVTFSTGELTPPLWLHGAAHTPDWIERHKWVAGGNSELCGSCHTSDYCTDCHDGKVRPRNVHPDDWISMHPQAARMDNPRCTSCHQLQTFCGDCHRRVGVARDTASGDRLSGRRFHADPQVWTTGPRGPMHHAWEAQRNLNECVACHTERDCATCHATKGLRGGAGVNPHPVGFGSSCSTPFQRNPRPCLVCHTQSDVVLASCQ